MKIGYPNGKKENKTNPTMYANRGVGLDVNVKLTMYIFDHLRMYKISHRLFLSDP